MIYRLLCILWLTTCCSQLSAQTPLTGKVIASDTKLPIASASVFLSNTSIGTATDSKGAFIINHIPSGRFDLVVSCIGYQTHVQTIYANQISDALLINLQPKAKELDEVIVEQYDKDGWDKWGWFFIRNLIGTSIYAQDCELLNANVVKFRRSPKTGLLRAFADEALVIRNKALGYTLHYQLTKFEYNDSLQLLLYQGYPLFEEMTSKSNKVAMRWELNRQDAYNGSLMHFMRSLYRNKVEQEGFEIRRTVKVKDDQSKRDKDILINTILPADSIAYAIDSTTVGLSFENYLYVTYTLKKEPDEYLTYQGKSKGDKVLTSQLYLSNKRPVSVLANGMYHEPLDMVTLGYWAWWEKLGNMLPFDYWPAVSLEK